MSKCLKCKALIYVKGEHFCAVCRESVDNLKSKSKWYLAGILAAVALGAMVWFHGIPALSCRIEQWSLDKDTEYVLVKGKCKVNMGTKEKPNWIWLNSMRGYASGESGGE